MHASRRAHLLAVERGEVARRVDRCLAADAVRHAVQVHAEHLLPALAEGGEVSHEAGRGRLPGGGVAGVACRRRERARERAVAVRAERLEALAPLDRVVADLRDRLPLGLRDVRESALQVRKLLRDEGVLLAEAHRRLLLALLALCLHRRPRPVLCVLCAAGAD